MQVQATPSDMVNMSVCFGANAQLTGDAVA
jgi:hypothetical protein